VFLYPYVIVFGDSFRFFGPPTLVNVWPWKLHCVPREMLGTFTSLESRRRDKLVGGCSAAAAGARAPGSRKSGQGNT
jgi:hypothetical protein